MCPQSNYLSNCVQQVYENEHPRTDALSQPIYKQAVIRWHTHWELKLAKCARDEHGS